jgi:hypothetical protein
MNIVRYHSLSSKHVARVVVAIMTEALEESFSLDEFETSVIENVAAVPIFVATSGKAKGEIVDRAKAG